MEATPPHSEPPAPPPPPTGEPAGAGPPIGDVYPVRLTVPRQPSYHRLLPFVKWLLAFPHYIVLFFLGIGAFIALFVAFFAVLFTGRFPEGLWTFVTGVYRWTYRVEAYVLLLTDEYPPFSLEDDPGYPARVEYDYPDRIDNWRPLVQWLLAIPYLFVAGALFGVAQIVAVIGAFVILFTKELPQGMFALILNPLRWQLRGNAYAAFLVKRYPPFEWEQ